MTIALGDNRYGKSGIHLVVVNREAQDHRITDLRVDIRLEGDFEAAHTSGDNRAVVPTDTMRGTVFAFARTQPVGQPEDFGLRLARHFVATVPAVTSADVRLRATPWARIGGHHPTAFLADRSVVRTAHVRVDARGAHVRGGVEDVNVFKSAESAFSDFYTDEYTTLPPTHDRMMATVVTADWGYRESNLDWGDSAAAVQRILLQAFADHDSASVQHTLYAMGNAVLTQRPDVTDVHLLLPNVHHLLVDLVPYGLDNPSMVFVAAPEPYGVIEATVVRGPS
jgi:urate oxidase